MKKKQSAPLTPALLSDFCYQLSLMLQAGIGSEECMSILAEEAPSPEEQRLLTAICAELARGRALSAALSKTGVFPDYLLRMVEIGEASGRLEQVCTALASYYRQETTIRSNIRQAIAYPACMAVLIVVIFFVLVARVLPVFQNVFTQMGISLSPTARALLQFGAGSKHLVTGFALAVCFCGAAGFLISRIPAAAAWFRKLFSRTAFSLTVSRSRYTSSMALMLSSGLPWDEAMGRTCRLLEGSPLAARLDDCNRRLESGISFPQAVKESHILTGIQANLLSAGFRAGVPEKAMVELARRCEAQADATLSALVGRFEYTLVVLLCLCVGLVLLSVMLPLLGVLSAIGG